MSLFKNSYASNSFENITKETNISAEEIIMLLNSDMAANLPKIKDGANNGNLNCQIFLWHADLQFIMKDEENPSLPTEVLASLNASFEHFLKLAAVQGDADSQYNLGKIFLCKFDLNKQSHDAKDFSNVREAKYWYEQARLNGRDDLEGTISNATELLKYEP